MAKRFSSVAVFCLLFAIVAAGCASVPRDRLYPSAPTLLPGTTADMNVPGFWIGRHPAPDRIILDPAEIAAFNRGIRDAKLVRDLSAAAPIPGAVLRKELSDAVGWIGSLYVYQNSGHRVDQRFLKPLEELEDAGSIPDSVEPAFGFLCRRADLRVLPTAAPLYDEPGDRFIDNLQASSLEPGTPLLLLHRSADGLWFYVSSELASGWVLSEAIAETDRDTFLCLYSWTDRFVVTADRAELYEDPELTRFAGYLRMGTSLPPGSAAVGDVSAGPVEILYPGRDKTGRLVAERRWVDSSQIHRGYLPYTARTMYRQAFLLLNAPYGWGGTFGERDCSQFMCELFSVVGISLPRNSSAQAKIGTPLNGFVPAASESEKARILDESAIPGATLLRLPGHIMLYLGTVDGRPYAIHSTWAYKERRLFSDVIRLVNRVVVSDLELGAGSAKGSHLHRLTTAAEVFLPPTASSGN